MERTPRGDRPDPLRRGLLVSALGLLAGRMIRAQETVRPDDPELSAVRTRLEELRLRPVRWKASERYLVVGDAPEAFLGQALALCDALAKDYLSHFQARGFAVERQAERLTVVVLSGPEAYGAYLGVPAEAAVGGHYDLDTNRLVLFDNRARADAGPLVALANRVSLMHEATHQLTFNTGLLDRRAEIPLCVSEGLAMYAETRSPDGRGRIGQVNRERLDVLRATRPWPKAAELFASDAVLDAPESEQVGYALSWLLVYHLMQPGDRLAGFRKYLASLKAGAKGGNRVARAEAALGELGRLDGELVRTATRLARR
jgi:hypothetical protein